jgi:hypothetical protein
MYYYKLSALAAAMLIPMISGEALQINMYSGESCVEGYLLSYEPFTNGDCYNYGWDGSNAQGIVNCPDGDTCACEFFTEYDCQGTETQSYYTEDCVQGSFFSVQCVAYSNSGVW